MNSGLKSIFKGGRFRRKRPINKRKYKGFGIERVIKER
jgi:hypothetical protein